MYNLDKPLTSPTDTRDLMKKSQKIIIKRNLKHASLTGCTTTLEQKIILTPTWFC